MQITLNREVTFDKIAISQYSLGSAFSTVDLPSSVFNFFSVLKFILQKSFTLLVGFIPRLFIEVIMIGFCSLFSFQHIHCWYLENYGYVLNLYPAKMYPHSEFLVGQSLVLIFILPQRTFLINRNTHTVLCFSKQVCFPFQKAEEQHYGKEACQTTATSGMTPCQHGTYLQI